MLQLEWVFTAGGIVVTSSIVLYAICSYKRKKDYPQNTIILHVIPRIREAPNPSPFSIKLETYLRMAKLPYQVAKDYGNTVITGPWITYNGEVFSDSQFIIEFLNKKFENDFNSHLTDEQRGIARAMQKMVEENLFWTLALSRFVYCYSDPSLKEIIPVSRCLLWKAKNTILKQTYCHGIGRHTPSEVKHIAMGDLKALSDFIGEKKFLMGDKPCETDCAIFGMVAMSRQMPKTSFCTKFIEDNIFPNLTAYFERMKDMYWPDWFTPDLKVPTFGLHIPKY